MNRKGQIATTIIIALVVAVIASVATLAITGNSVLVKDSKNKGVAVYTKAEVDKLLSDNVASPNVFYVPNLEYRIVREVGGVEYNRVSFYANKDDVCMERKVGDICYYGDSEIQVKHIGYDGEGPSTNGTEGNFELQIQIRDAHGAYYTNLYGSSNLSFVGKRGYFAIFKSE